MHTPREQLGYLPFDAACSLARTRCCLLRSARLPTYLRVDEPLGAREPDRRALSHVLLVVLARDRAPGTARDGADDHAAAFGEDRSCGPLRRLGRG